MTRMGVAHAARVLVSAARRNDLSSLTTNSESLREQVDTSLRQGYGLAGQWTLMGKEAATTDGWMKTMTKSE